MDGVLRWVSEHFTGWSAVDWLVQGLGLGCAMLFAGISYLIIRGKGCGPRPWAVLIFDGVVDLSIALLLPLCIRLREKAKHVTSEFPCRVALINPLVGALELVSPSNSRARS
eukprot:RCo000072